MSKELIVSTGKHETRVAILEDDQLVEVFHEREKEYSLAGSIHKGRVTRVLPGMQSAFVDIGLERDAFLYVSDFFEDNEEYDAVVSTVEDKVFKQLEKKPEPAYTNELAPAPVIDGAVAPPPPASVAPVERREGSGRDRNERGGRGRRGRRRRGGRDSGLPDSKFFTPREGDKTDDSPVDEPFTESAAEIETPSPVYSRAVSDDFMVLPGESLAKYSAGDGEEEETVDEPDQVEAGFEPAMPGDHPFAAFGGAPVAEEVSISETFIVAEVSDSPSHTAQQEDAVAEEVVEAAAEPVGTVSEPESPVPPIDVPVGEPDPVLPEGDPAVPDPALPEDEPGIDEPGIDEPGIDEPGIEEPAAEPTDESEFSAEGGEGEATEAEAAESENGEPEGPEPARIPTSLTATLREQGHRYPHRASRRMRRKMRSERQPNNAAAAPAEGASEEASVRTVETRDENAPPREQREKREGRENREPRENREGRENRANREGRGERPERQERGERPERERPPLPSIADLLKEGQEIIVQIAKEPLGQKGARITSHIALPGRFVVYMPTVDHAGVSRKIPSDEERQRLKRLVQTHRQGIPGGFICRTAAEGKTEEELKSDMHFLYNLWLDMRAKAEKKPAPVLLHHDLDLVQRILRDQLTASFKNIWVDGEELYESVLRFAQRFQPALIGRVKLYTRANPIFDEFGITAELEKALRPKVWLKSGGYIVINQTEALVAIDINTGKYVGKSNRLEDTIVKINTDAIKEIVRQIRLRDLGGIIVVDFIDMDERRNRQKVMQVLEETMRADRAPYKILQFNDFGLVAITRKRVKQSLERTLCSPCPYCEGAGYVKSVNTVVSEILQEAQRMHRSLETDHNLVLRVNPEVARVLKSNQNQFLQEIEEILGKSVLVKGDPLLHQTKFDLA